MKYFPCYLAVALILIVGLFLLSHKEESDEPQRKTTAESQSTHLEKSETGELPHIVFSESAIRRIGIETRTISDTVRIIPYEAIIYGLDGQTWVYAEKKPATYMRESVFVDHIDGNQVFLSESLIGARAIVVTGVAELFGFEYGVGEAGH